MKSGRRNGPDIDPKSPLAKKTVKGVLPEGHEELRAILENMDAVFYRNDDEGRILMVSAGVAGLLGYTPDELIGTLAADLYVDPADRDGFIKAIRDAGGLVRDYRVVMRHRDGRKVHVSNSAHIYPIPGRDTPGIEGTVVDVSEEHLAHQALAREKERHLRLVEGLSDAVLIVSGGEIHFANRAGVDIFAAKNAQDMTGRTFLDFFDATRREFIAAWMERVERSEGEADGPAGTFTLHEETLTALSGERVCADLSAHPMVDPAGNGSLQVVVRDVSERKAREELLNLSDRVFRDSPDVISVVGRDFRYRTVNHAYVDFYGYPQALIERSRVPDLMGSQKFNAVVRPRMELCLAGEKIQYEDWFISPLRGRRYMHTTYTPLENGRGRIDGLVVVSRDITERKLAEDRLVDLNDDLERRVEARARTIKREMNHRGQLERRLASMLKSSPSVIYELAIDGDNLTPVWVSDNISRIFGYTAVECLKPSWWLSNVHPDDTDEVLKNAAQLFEKGEITHQYRFKGKDGGYFWVQDTLRVVENSDGTRVAVGGWTDITELREARTQIHESEERFRAITETAPVAIFLSNFQTSEIYYANPAAARLFGYDLDDLLAVNGIDLYVDPEDRKRTQQAVQQGDEVHYEQEHYRRADGTAFWGVRSISRSHINGHDTLVTVLNDIDNLKKTEHALRQSEARFRDIAETASDWFWEMDADLRLVMTQQDSFKRYGFRQEDYIGKTRLEIAGIDLDRLEGAELEKWQAHLDDLENQRPFQNFEYEIMPPKGGMRTLRVNGTPYFDDDGTFLGYRGTTSDITDQKKAENEVRIARDMAEQAVRVKSEFMAAMSHELRTPLNAIIGFSEMMSRQILGPLGNDAYGEYANNIHSSGERLLSVINDILDISEIESGSLTLREDAVYIKDVADDLFKKLANVAEEDGLSFVMALPDGLPALIGDRRRISQALENLLNNAIKFTPRGGQVALTATEDRDGTVRLQVSDTGIGMTPEEIDRAEEPFSQVDSAINRKYEGLGLGLSLARRLIEAHDGGLTIESVPGKGTTATLLFPKSRVAQA